MNLKTLLIALVLTIFLLSGCKNAPTPSLQETVHEDSESPMAEQETRASISVVPDESSAIQFVAPSSP